MFNQYFENEAVKSEFSKEFVSLWSGWLGKDQYHKLDEVTQSEWVRFNNLIKLLAKNCQIALVDCDSQTVTKVTDIQNTLASYEESMNKKSSLFSQYIFPELGCVFTEEWDYTYIIWHKNNGAIEALEPFITAAGLYHFR
ncbi:MAG: hypothetical protein HRT35_16820 [Algicola sp.]|nr:hypothetical protein [Algicola sp.]